MTSKQGNKPIRFDRMCFHTVTHSIYYNSIKLVERAKNSVKEIFCTKMADFQISKYYKVMVTVMQCVAGISWECIQSRRVYSAIGCKLGSKCKSQFGVIYLSISILNRAIYLC